MLPDITDSQKLNLKKQIRNAIDGGKGIEELIRDKIPGPMLKSRWNEMTLQELHDYRDFFTKHQCITNKINQLLEEERQEILSYVSASNDLDIDQISQKTLVSSSVIKQILN